MIDVSVGESPNNRFCKTFREVWDDLLSWEEIRDRKHRRRFVISSSEPSSSPVLFPSPSSFSLSTSVAQATPLMSVSFRDGSIVKSVRIPNPPCLRAVFHHAVIHTEEISGKTRSDLRFDFVPYGGCLWPDICVNIFRVNYYYSHLEVRAQFTMPDADRPVKVLPDASLS